jgi:ribosomal protein S18 acetylase RimI-like enzyme
MIADTPVAYLETLADARAHPPEYWSAAALARSTGCVEATFVAELGGEFVGMVGGFGDSQGRTVVVSVYVTPAHRGTGLIDRLVDEVAAWSLACGREELVLEVARQNPRAVAAYDRLGFVVTGAEAPHPLFPEVTEVEMARPARWSPRASGSSRPSPPRAG